MELTREEAIRNYREHWASLAITGTSDKTEYLKRNGYSDVILNCFLCQFAGVNRDNNDCSKCPIEWPKTHEPHFINRSFPCLASYFDDWNKSDTPEERKRLAAIIRDLSEKEVEAPKPEPKFKVGQKVIPVSKTVPGWINRAPNWNICGGKEQGFLYVRYISSDLTEEHQRITYVCGAPKTGEGGDYYFESDLRPYVEPPKSKFKVGDIVKIKPLNELKNLSQPDTFMVVGTTEWENALNKFMKSRIYARL